MQLDDREGCVTDLGFDLWFARECSEQQTARLQAHLDSCARCRVRGELLERERHAFLSQMPTLADHAEYTRRLRRSPPGPLRSARSWLPLAAAAAAATVIALVIPPVSRPSERLKGGFSIGFYLKHGERVRRGVSGETVYPGDQLRFTYSSDAPIYLALFGRDEHGASLYFPASAEAVRVAAGRERALDFSLEFDAQLGTEQLFVVSCPTAYPLAPLRDALLDTSDLQLPAACRVERIALRKEAPP